MPRTLAVFGRVSFLEPWSLLRGKKSVVLSSLIIAGGGGQARGASAKAGARLEGKTHHLKRRRRTLRVLNTALSEASLGLSLQEGGRDGGGGEYANVSQDRSTDRHGGGGPAVGLSVLSGALCSQ